MDDVCSEDIRYLRQKLGWSGEEMARVLGRSKVTIFNWESGKTRPEGNTRAVLRAMERDYDRRCASQSQEEVEEWASRVKKQGLHIFLQDLRTRPGFQQKVYAKIASKATMEGGFLLSTSDRPLAYVIPMTQLGLLRFCYDLLTEENTGNNLGKVINLVNSIRSRTETDIEASAGIGDSICD